MTRHKNYIAIAIALLIIVGVGYGLYSLQKEGDTVQRELPGTTEIPEGAHVVTLTKDGFSPSQLSIEVGETVAFRTENGDLFWPASNLHPSHTIYSEFDPRGPVEPSHAWSFTFTKIGAWKYHDHLAPYYTGVITVTE